MKSNKELNKAMDSLLGREKEYDLRREFRIIESGLSLENAQAAYLAIPEEERHLCSLTSSSSDNYTEDLNLAVSAAKRIAEQNNQTFVLSLEDGVWKAAYGDWGDCAEYKGANPAYVTCVSILKYMGKL